MEQEKQDVLIPVGIHHMDKPWCQTGQQYVGDRWGKNVINYSVTMNGISSCPHSCCFCSIARAVDYTQGVNKGEALVKDLTDLDDMIYTRQYKTDWSKFYETMEHNSRFKRAKDVQEKQGIQCKVNIDLWGGDPVTNFKATQDVVSHLKNFFELKHGMKVNISTSTGGLPLARREICEYMVENNMGVQLSHEGLGNWMRTGDMDLLHDERTADNIKNLFLSGHLNMINTCLNFYNHDVFANKKFWDDYFKEISLPDTLFKNLFIKLNRVYDGQYDIKQTNRHGWFNGQIYPELVGKPIGDLSHHNWLNLNSGNLELDRKFAHELDDYMAQWLQIAIMMQDPDIINSVPWKPYTGYLSEQVQRWQWLKNRDQGSGVCRNYQRTVAGVSEHPIPPNEHGDVEMFVIDTTGRYCECNLCDADQHVANPGCAWEPEECKYCRFYLQSECNGCGSEKFKENCEFRYRWVSLLEQVKQMGILIESVKRHERIDMAKQILGGNNKCR